MARSLARVKDESQWYAGYWIEFTDEEGYGWAQPDLFGVADDRVILFECKFTRQERAHEQMEKTYIPLLHHLWPDKPVARIQVYQAFREVLYPCGQISSVGEALASPTDTRVDWHWIR